MEFVCQSKGGSGKTAGQHAVHELETDEELLVLSDADTDRWYTRLKINDRTVRFLLDCGATVNLLPEAFVRSIGRMGDVRPSTATLRMFDKSKLQTSGVITLSVQTRPFRRYRCLSVVCRSAFERKSPQSCRK